MSVLVLPYLEQRSEMATKGPWSVNHDDNGLAVVETEDCTGVAYDLIHDPDAAFIAAADPVTVGVLCSAYRQAVEALDEIAECGCRNRMAHEGGSVTCIAGGYDWPNQCFPCRAYTALASLAEQVSLDTPTEEPS